VINGCCKSPNGQLRLIDPASDNCLPSETANLVAPDRDARGPKGDKGEKGDQGIPAIPGQESCARKDDPRHIRDRIYGNRRRAGRHIGDVYGFIAAAPTPHLLNPVLRRRRTVPEPIKTRRPRLAIFART